MSEQLAFGDCVIDTRGALRYVSYQMGVVIWFLDGGMGDVRDVRRAGG